MKDRSTLTDRSRKAQFALEFVALVSFLLILFITFSALATNQIATSKEIERQQTAAEIAALAHNEIELARAAQNGYTREFNLPIRLQGIDYSISLIDNREIVVFFIDKEHVIFLEDGINGTLRLGKNKVERVSGIVYVNNAN